SRYNLSYSTEYRNDFKFIKDQNVRHLIIDLRGNEGGNLTIGMDLLKYIFTGAYRPYLYHEVNNYRFPSLYKYMNDSTAFDKFPDSLFVKVAGNTFRSDPRVKTEVWSRPMEPVTDPYTAKLYVLINGATGSAASILATLIRVNRKDAIFVGEESGGDMEGPVSGDGLSIVLPNTRLRADIPFIKRVVNLNGYPNKKGRGIIPDHHIIPTPENVVNNEDAELIFTLRLIQGI
ncbi:MAG TPA: S41 family peptidase, partial [Flavitalea sp.]|nr:S41 family peptidase [Flavitalea sp.]